MQYYVDGQERSAMGERKRQGEPQTMSPGRKRVCIVSDNQGLARAIGLNLRVRLKVDVQSITPGPSQTETVQAIAEDCNLIVVAISSPASEPIVVLARTALLGLVDQVPLIIISDRPFRPDWDRRIVHLDFPFGVDELCRTVDELLHREPDTTLVDTHRAG